MKCWWPTTAAGEEDDASRRGMVPERLPMPCHIFWQENQRLSPPRARATAPLRGPQRVRGAHRWDMLLDKHFLWTTSRPREPGASSRECVFPPVSVALELLLRATGFDNDRPFHHGVRRRHKAVRNPLGWHKQFSRRFVTMPRSQGLHFRAGWRSISLR